MPALGRLAVAAAVLALALYPAAAFGHAQLVSTDPEAGSNLQQPVDHIIINVTETPVENASSVEVTDGCERVLASDLFTEEKTIHVNVNEVGAPGRWTVVWDTLSAEDGHTSGGDFAFRVAGEKDCSQAAESPGPDSAAPDAEEEDESGFPVVPVAAAAIAIAGVALLARGSAKG